MKIFNYSLNAFLIIFLVSCGASKKEEASISEAETKTVIQTENDSEVKDEFAYDADLANALGADDYGMKTYIMAFLKAGPNRDHDSVEIAEMQRAHLDNINRMAEEGSLVLAGPFLDDTEMRGIYLFDVATVEEAEELTKTDPMIVNERLIFEFHPWYGAAVLPLVNDWYKKVTKTEI
ncbi:MAG: hypothetical protein JXQ87_00100 [Bacteroidia bacterium]